MNEVEHVQALLKCITESKNRTIRDVYMLHLGSHFMAEFLWI